MEVESVKDNPFPRARQASVTHQVRHLDSKYLTPAAKARTQFAWILAEALPVRLTHEFARPLAAPHVSGIRMRQS